MVIPGLMKSDVFSEVGSSSASSYVEVSNHRSDAWLENSWRRCTRIRTSLITIPCTTLRHRPRHRPCHPFRPKSWHRPCRPFRYQY
jgi:hypothetical protein